MPKTKMCVGCGEFQPKKRFPQVEGKLGPTCNACCKKPPVNLDELLEVTRAGLAKLRGEGEVPEPKLDVDFGELRCDLEALRAWCRDSGLGTEFLPTLGVATKEFDAVAQGTLLRNSWLNKFQCLPVGIVSRIFEPQPKTAAPSLPGYEKAWGYSANYSRWSSARNARSKELNRLEAHISALEQATLDASAIKQAHEKGSALLAQQEAEAAEVAATKAAAWKAECDAAAERKAQERLEYLEELSESARGGPLEFARAVEKLRAVLAGMTMLREEAERVLAEMLEKAGLDPLEPTPEAVTLYGEVNCESLAAMVLRTGRFRREHVGCCCERCGDPRQVQWRGEKLFGPIPGSGLRELPNFVDSLPPSE